MKNNKLKNRNKSEYERKKHATIITTATRTCVVSFFCNDNNSRTTAGVRETVTKDGEMMQKRYLLKFVPDLYKDFAADNFATTISASSFMGARSRDGKVIP